MKKLLASIIAIILVSGLYANNEKSTIKGQVYDSITREALAFTTVSLHLNDSTVVAVATTSDDGSFVFNDISMGDYKLKTSFIGYNDYVSQVRVDAQVIIVSDILLEEDSEMLAAAVVTSKVPVIEQKIDKLIMNVSEAVSTAGSNATDILKKAPGVSVDNNGNITLNGNKVDVWIDGRPSYLSGKELEAILLSTDATTIDKLEIMSHPSAKYDAQGSGGIINIKTKKNFMKGFNGSIAGSYGGMMFDRYLNDASGTINLGYRGDKTNTTLTYSPRLSQTTTDLSSKLLMDENLGSYQISNSQMQFNNSSQNLKFSNDWFINKKNVLGVIVNGLTREGDSFNVGDSYTDTYIENVLSISQKSKIENRDNFNSITANLNYTHYFDEKKGQEITFNADYSYYDQLNGSYQENLFLDPETKNTLPVSNIFRQNVNQDIDMYSMKLDYQQFFWKTGQIEAGAKWVKTNTDNNTLRENNIDDNWIKDDGLSDIFNYDEQVAAAYISAAKMFGTKFTAKLGLRGEYTFSNGEWSNNEPTSRKYFDLFPTAFISYNPSMDWRYSFSYSRRVTRPSFSQLNPFRFYIDATTYTEGNPYLKPQYADMLTLNLGFKSHLNLTMIYSHTNNLIIQDPVFHEDHSRVFKWSNFGTQSMTGAALSISELPITKWFILNASLFGAYNTNITKNDKGEIYRNNGFMSNAYVNTSYILPRDWKIELGGTIMGRLPYGYFQINPMYTLFAGVKKNLFNNKATISININDLLRSTNSDLELTDINGNVYYTMSQRSNMQKVTLSFVYRFGQVKPIKQRRVGINEDASRVNTSTSLGNTGTGIQK